MKTAKQLSANEQLLIIGVPIVVGVILAMALPESWGRDTGPLRNLTALMVSIVPSIEHFSSVSEFPGVTESFLAIMWLAVPLMAWSIYRYPGMFKTDRIGELKHKFGFLCIAVPAIGALILLPPLWPAIEFSTTSKRSLFGLITRGVSSSRFVLGAVGALVCWGCAMGIALLASLIKNFPYMFLGRRR